VAGLFSYQQETPMLDVHILTLPTSNREWFDQCVDSVMNAADRAGFPVDVHIVSGVLGHIGKGRAEGYALGHHPYVTFVDDDDFIICNAFIQMRNALRLGRALAISTPEKVLRNGCTEEGKQRHHLIAYQRKMVIDHTAWPCCGDVAQAASIPAEGWIDLPVPMYVHRVYESRARLMRREAQDELNQAVAYANELG
jgi:hypothetical protein